MENIKAYQVALRRITQDKTDLKKKEALLGEFICHLTHLFAEKFNHTKLAAAVNFNYDQIFKMKDSNIMTFATGVVAAITPFLSDPNFAPYKITSLMLDDLKKVAEEFTNHIGKAKEGSTENTTANTEIDRVLGLLIKNVGRFDKMMVFYEATEPKFVEGYHLNSSADHTGARHNGFEGTVKDAEGNPVSKALVRRKNTHHEATTDLNAKYRITKVRPGDYVVTISAEGYKTLEKIIHVHPRKIDELDFVLERN